tara:strand:- start:12259 stop:12603 length:345 start_codon:yes stop_codon:yes gene_type:complete
MEIASAINDVLERLRNKDKELTLKIASDTDERTRLTNIIRDLKKNVESLDLAIKNSNAELTSLKRTIHETEDGYNKITEAGKTLMAIVSQNLPKLQKIDTKAEDKIDVPCLERV